MLVKARLKWREKLELLILFSGGLFVMMAGILRCVLILTVSCLRDIAAATKTNSSLGWRKRGATSWKLGLPRDFRGRHHR
jgi:hypothetical protein